MGYVYCDCILQKVPIRCCFYNACLSIFVSDSIGYRFQKNSVDFLLTQGGNGVRFFSLMLGNWPTKIISKQNFFFNSF